QLPLQIQLSSRRRPGPITTELDLAKIGHCHLAPKLLLRSMGPGLRRDDSGVSGDDEAKSPPPARASSPRTAPAEPSRRRAPRPAPSPAHRLLHRSAETCRGDARALVARRNPPAPSPRLPGSCADRACTSAA